MMRNRFGVEVKKGYYVWGAWGNQRTPVEGTVVSIDRTSDYAKAYGVGVKIRQPNNDELIVHIDEVNKVLPPMRVTRGGVVKANPLQRVKVNSRSQLTGLPPDARLKKRRKKTDAMPIPGVWANPPTEARELWLYARNLFFIVNESRAAFQSNAGPAKWKAIALKAARDYSAAFGNGSARWRDIFSDDDLSAVGSMLRDDMQNEAEDDAQYAGNPLTRTTPYADSQRERASAAGGRTKSPSRRLVKRRKYTQEMPEGFYANPGELSGTYLVQRKAPSQKKWENFKSFAYKKDAVDFAEKLHFKNPQWFVRVWKV